MPRIPAYRFGQRVKLGEQPRLPPHRLDTLASTTTVTGAPTRAATPRSQKTPTRTRPVAGQTASRPPQQLHRPAARDIIPSSVGKESGGGLLSARRTWHQGETLEANQTRGCFEGLAFHAAERRT